MPSLIRFMRFGACTLMPVVLSTSVVMAQVDDVPDPSPVDVAWDVAYTGELFAGVRGGLERKVAYLHNIDLSATVDFAALRHGGPYLHAYVLGNHGGDPSTFVGDAQSLSNIAADDAWRLFELWMESSALQNRVSLLAGLYDLNSEFDVTEAGGFFVNSSFGIGAEFGASGHHGPSIFPTTGLAARIRWLPSDPLYLQFGIFDAVPGDPERPRRMVVKLAAEEGALMVLQVGLRRTATVYPAQDDAQRRALLTRNEDPSTSSALAVGVWRYTGSFEQLGDENGFSVGSMGAYLLAEHELPLARGIGDAARCFFRSGWADPRVNRFVGSLSGGCVVDGLLQTTLEQQIGLAFTAAFNGSRFLHTSPVDESRTRAETAIELAYAVTVSSYVGLQTSIQYILNPDTRREVPDALAAGLRLRIAL